MTLFGKITHRRVGMVLLCGALFMGMVAQPVDVWANNAASYQNDIDRINSEMKELEEKKQSIQASISSTKSAKEQEEERKQRLDDQISITRNEIALLEERIAVLEEAIAEKEQEIADKQISIDENYVLFQQRIRALYIQDDASVLGLLLGADSFADFLTKTEIVTRIAEHDQDLIDTLTLEYQELEQAQQELQEAMELLDADRSATLNKKQELDTQVSEVQENIQDMESLEAQFQADLAATQALVAAMQSELENIYRQIEWDKNPYVGGEMAWPVPGYYNITSDYGYRFGGSDYHTGIDISGTNVYGQPIVAANDGTVKFVNWTYTPGRGYGIYLIVDHGGGVSTLYGHTSNIVVSVGDVVTAGQKIAEVGSTGWSTGPHLHFEVRIDGSHVNPKPYVMG